MWEAQLLTTLGGSRYVEKFCMVFFAGLAVLSSSVCRIVNMTRHQDFLCLLGAQGVLFPVCS